MTMLKIAWREIRFARRRWSLLVESVSMYDLGAADGAMIRRRTIGFLFQTFNLVPCVAASENVQAPLHLSGMAAPHQKERAAGLLDMVGIGDRLHPKPSELSVGQQQRVALDRALANDPKRLLADQPTGTLYPEQSAAVMEHLCGINAVGTTVVTGTRDPAVAACV